MDSWWTLAWLCFQLGIGVVVLWFFHRAIDLVREMHSFASDLLDYAYREKHGKPEEGDEDQKQGGAGATAKAREKPDTDGECQDDCAVGTGDQRASRPASPPEPCPTCGMTTGTLGHAVAQRAGDCQPTPAAIEEIREERP